MNKGSEIDPDMDARAKECLRLYLAGDFEPSELIFGRPPPADEKPLRAKMRELLGEAESITLTAADTNEFGITTYRYNVCFRNAGQLEYHFGMNSDGKISRFSIVPVPGRAGPLKQYFEQGLAKPSEGD
jgi:hypothetical protein